MKKIVIAPDSFKESLSALQVCNIIEKGFKAIFPSLEVVKIPLADGGEGTMEVITNSLGGKIVNVITLNANGVKKKSRYGLINAGKTAIIEIAESSGLAHIPLAERNPLYATSYGTGQLINHALNSGIEELIIGLGGSATNDGGVGIMQALGVKFLNKHKKNISHGGIHLQDIVAIDTTNINKNLATIKTFVACDVNNPLCGGNGASHIFGPQKGATPKMILQLDKSLRHFAHKIKELQHIEIKNVAGAGAAGGTPASLLTFFKNVNMQPGIEIIGNLVNLEQKSKDADLIITGEGKIDFQTLAGKTPIAPLKVAKKYNIPIIAIAGALGQGYDKLLQAGFNGLYSVTTHPTTLKEALSTTENNLYNLSISIANLLNVSRTI